MAKIAIMGFGTVGSGVLEVCRRNAASIARRAGEPVEVKYILDVRDFSGSPDAALFTKSIDTILNDPEIKVVVETIGGTKFATRMCASASRAGAASAPPTRRWSQPTAQSCWPLPKSTARPSCLRPALAAARRSSPDAPVPGRQPYQQHPRHRQRHDELHADEDEAREHGL